MHLHAPALGTVIVLAKEPRPGFAKTRLTPPLTPRAGGEPGRGRARGHVGRRGRRPGPAPRARLRRRRRRLAAGRVGSRRATGGRPGRAPRGGLRRGVRAGRARRDGHAPTRARRPHRPGTRPATTPAWARPPTAGTGPSGSPTRRHAAAVLPGVPMSQDDTGAHQLARLRAHGLRVQLLDELTDVDTIAAAHEVARLVPHGAFGDRVPAGGLMEPGALAPYESALLDDTRPLLALHAADGTVVALDVARWLAPTDACDESVLDRCTGPVLDVGCGPGRFVSALTDRGIAALGVDIAETAVALARGRGLAAMVRSVFSDLPGEGRWPTVLLMDGNIGIGGDPAPPAAPHRPPARARRPADRRDARRRRVRRGARRALHRARPPGGSGLRLGPGGHRGAAPARRVERLLRRRVLGRRTGAGSPCWCRVRTARASCRSGSRPAPHRPPRPAGSAGWRRSRGAGSPCSPAGVPSRWISGRAITVTMPPATSAAWIQRRARGRTVRASSQPMPTTIGESTAVVQRRGRRPATPRAPPGRSTAPASAAGTRRRARAGCRPRRAGRGCAHPAHQSTSIVESHLVLSTPARSGAISRSG